MDQCAPIDAKLSFSSFSSFSSSEYAQTLTSLIKTLVPVVVDALAVLC